MNDSPYVTLVARLRHLACLGSVSDLLGWDEQVNLPTGAHDWRAAQLGAMAEVCHQAATEPDLGKLIETLEKREDLTAEQACVVREARKEYDRATRLPADFVSEKAQVSSHAYHAWAKAREEDDFAQFAPLLQKQLELSKREADYLGYSDAPYDYFLDKHDPGMRADVIAELFSELKKGLQPLSERILNAPVQAKKDIFKNFSIEKQAQFLREVITALGFDFRHGRLDTAVHPFCGGHALDTRMTTRYHEDNPLDSLFSGIHETGHALYEQGLPPEMMGNALGEAVGMAIHESQSRLWENQVARSRAFWQYWEPKFREAFPEELAAVSSEELYLAINAVARNPIRVDADEVTYNLHIILRFELEQRLFAGTLVVNELPEAWNTLAKELLGLSPSNHREGVLQDVHWSCGEFGYFPSYCLGNMIAAQLWACAEEALPYLPDTFAQGNYAPLLNWLREKIHHHGKRFDTLTLTEQATGQPLSPAALLRYLEARYLPLYEGG